MWQNLNPKYGPVKNDFSSKVRKFARKAWRKIKIYLEHDEYRMLNQLPRYNSDVIKIGDLTYGHPDTNSPRVVYFGEKSSLEIGKYCSVAENVTIFIGGYHNADFISTYPFFVAYSDVAPVKMMVDKGKTTIGNDVWIGAHVIIMAGVTIGNGAVIAAGSVIVKDVMDYEVVGGNPAKAIRKRFSEDQIKALLKIGWWNWDINKIKANAHLLNSESIDLFIEQFNH